MNLTSGGIREKSQLCINAKKKKKSRDLVILCEFPLNCENKGLRLKELQCAQLVIIYVTQIMST